MKMLALAALAASFTGGALLAQQQPTSNPDSHQQRQPAPASPSTGTSQQQADVPQQKPDAKSPDMKTQQHHTKKKKKGKSTTSTASPGM